jgi:hypothetical protein
VSDDSESPAPKAGSRRAAGPSADVASRLAERAPQREREKRDPLARCGSCVGVCMLGSVYLVLAVGLAEKAGRTGDVLGAATALISLTAVIFFGIWTAKILMQHGWRVRFSLRTLLLGQLFLAGSVGSMIFFLMGRSFGVGPPSAMLVLGLGLVWSAAHDLGEFKGRERADRSKARAESDEGAGPGERHG